ncbi:MAG TPA: DNA methyltransferase [Thermoanaerobaculia bacterium]|nr:DNA methyltransferase [Thermoanaerobaculia bacterium]
MTVYDEGASWSVTSPKPRPNQNWYSYYAGYSERFAAEALALLDLPSQSLVLDPWNGSGTTTAVARALGHRPVGYDLNPSMVIVAKARLLDLGVLPSVDSIASEILAEASSTTPDDELHEPLSAWFMPAAARCLRAIELGLQRVLVSHDEVVCPYEAEVADTISTLAAFFYVCLFRTVRANLARFISTNPTWIKVPHGPSEQINPPQSSLSEQFRGEARVMTNRLRARAAALDCRPDESSVAAEPRIKVANSIRLPDQDSTIDAVLCSPPYCTRIDYAVATRAELATLGMSSERFLVLREALLGGTLHCTGTQISPTLLWGGTCNDFLQVVSTHSSKASSTYYWRGFVRYFERLYASLIEIDRVLKPGSCCITVVQDSFYKGERADLQRIVVEMGEALGWTERGRFDFHHARTKAAVNPRSRKYRQASCATESVLLFKKAALSPHNN